MRLGYTWQGKGEAETQLKAKEECFKQAIGFFLRIGLSYQAFPNLAAEGLFRGASLYEAQAALQGADLKKRAESLQNAVKYDKRCIDEYPNSEWAPKCRERLVALTASPTK